MTPETILGLVSGQAGHTVIAFVAAVAVDDILGVAAAVRNKAFDASKLPSWLESQLGTKQAMALLGLVGAAYLSGGDIRAAALAALAAGGGAMTLSLVKDIVQKARVVGGFAAAQPSTPSA